MGKRSIASVVKWTLNAAWWAVAAVLGCMLTLLAFSIFIDIGGDKLTLSLPVAVQVDAPIHALSGEAAARFGKLRGDLLFPARQGAFLTGSMAVISLMFAYLLWMVTQLRYVFRSLSQRSPFDAENARRIHWIGLAVIFGEIARAAIIWFWSDYTSRHFTVSGVHFAASVDLNAITIVGGLAILAIAEVFREGARLQEEQSLTI